MTVRSLPVRPDLNQLKRQAKELLRAVRRGDPEALAEFAGHLPETQHHPEKIDPATVKLADAQLALARSYQAPKESFCRASVWAPATTIICFQF